jgi:hypothetical protein
VERNVPTLEEDALLLKNEDDLAQEALVVNGLFFTEFVVDAVY